MRNNEVKHRLWRRGMTLKSFASENGFSYRTVSDTVRGIRKGYYGESRQVIEELRRVVGEDAI